MALPTRRLAQRPATSETTFGTLCNSFQRGNLVASMPYRLGYHGLSLFQEGRAQLWRANVLCLSANSFPGAERDRPERRAAVADQPVEHLGPAGGGGEPGGRGFFPRQSRRVAADQQPGRL